MTKTTRSLSLLAFAVALIGLLLILGPNLHRIELGPGKPNLAPPEEVQTMTPDLGPNPTGASLFAILLRILFTAAVACLAFIVVGAIFKKELRAYLILFVILVLLFVGAYYLLRPIVEPFEPDPPAQSPALGLMEDRPLPPVEEEAPPPPGWSFTAVAIAISIGIAVLFAVAWAKLAPRWRRRERDDNKTELEELIETVGAAADEIQLGGDPRSAVLRCYREMIRILCGKQTIDHVHMTARELAAALHRVGFTARHVDQLTEIFELVRYGNRGGQPLAERAIGCLKAIREAYAT